MIIVKIYLGISLELLRAVGSVQFQIVPCSSLYFSRSIGPFQSLISANYRVLICCTCHFQSGSLFFVYFGFLCLQAPQCLISTLTQGGEGGHLFSCAVGREEHCKQISLMCGSARSVWTTLGLPQLTAVCAFCVYTTQAPGCSEGDLSKAGPGFRALPRSKLLRFRLSSTPQRLSCLHAFVPFPGPSSSGNQVLGEHTVPGGPWVLSPPRSWPLPGALQEYHLRCAMCLLWGADVRLRPSWQMSASQYPRKT